MERLQRFLESWAPPMVENSNECLPDSVLLAIATNKVTSDQYQAHVESCQACSTVVMLLKETLQEPGKNLASLIEQAKKDVTEVKHQEHRSQKTGARQNRWIWAGTFFREKWIPITAAVAVLLAVFWGPISKRYFGSIKQSEAHIIINVDDQFTPAMHALQNAIVVVSAPNTTEEQKRVATLAARNKILATNADALTRAQIEALNARSSNLQMLYTATMSHEENRPQPEQDLQTGVYTAYEMYKAATESTKSHQFILAPVDPQQATNRAKKEIQVSTEPTGKTIIVVPRSSEDSRNPQWLRSAMQDVADQNGVTVEIHSGAMVQTFHPRNE